MRMGISRGYRGVGKDNSKPEQNTNDLKTHHARFESVAIRRTLDREIAIEAAEVANRAESRFLTDGSHALRALLDGIMGIGELHIRRTVGVETKSVSREVDLAYFDLSLPETLRSFGKGYRLIRKRRLEPSWCAAERYTPSRSNGGCRAGRGV